MTHNRSKDRNNLFLFSFLCNLFFISYPSLGALAASYRAPGEMSMEGTKGIWNKWTLRKEQRF